MNPIVLTRRAAALMLGAGAFGLARAQAWPARPVRIVTAFGAGSASDIVARMLAEELQATFKQAFVVENKPGASGLLAAEMVAKSAPDGHTLFLSTNTAHSVNPHLFKKLPYEPIASFTPIARICYFPFVLAVNANLPVQNVEQLVAYCRNTQNKATYAYGNSTGQIAGAAFATLARLDVAAVPYKSTPQGLTDLVGGQVSFMFVDLASSRAHVKSGRLRLLAMSSEQRSAQVPDVPPLAQAGNLPGFDLSAWVGVLAPAGLPADITARLGDQLQQIVARKDIVERLQTLGADVAPAGPAAFDAYMKEQLQAWGRKVRDAGITPE
jgi:tripartite-type tricarboxylate transporter receptor subunit TctC